MASIKKIAVISHQCVACGVCVKACPRQAISVYKGMWARVDAALCVGCGVCGKACPAGVIAIKAREAAV